MYSFQLIFDNETEPAKFWSIKCNTNEGGRIVEDYYTLEYGVIGQNRIKENVLFNKDSRFFRFPDLGPDYDKSFQIDIEHNKKIAEGYKGYLPENFINENIHLKVKFLLNKLKEKGIAKKTWIPITEEKETTYKNSKFGGGKYLIINSEEINCKACSRPFIPLFQIDLKSVPQNSFPFNEGLLQFFYCLNCEGPDYLGREDMGIKARILNLETDQLIEYDFKEFYPEKAIIDWKFIGYEVHPEMFDFIFGQGDSYSLKAYSEFEPLLKDFSEEENKLIQEIGEFYMSRSDKIGGYGKYIQGYPYLKCKICNKELKHIVQIGSEINIPYMWGDGGIAHVFICEDHKENRDFSFDCS
jgi:uncharacterized protein YwqG